MMGQEINLLAKYPKSKRDITNRKADKDQNKIIVARKFGKDYFDGDRIYGYGGYHYNKKYWGEVVKTFISNYKLTENSSILDVGCAKGFMLHDFKNEVKNIRISGIDISRYAVENSLESVKSFLKVGNATKLPYEDNSFDLVISINTVHNLNEEDCKKALHEIERVSRKYSFITVDAYGNQQEKERMDDWNLTALTYKSKDEWKKFFHDAGYAGDYYWFIP